MLSRLQARVFDRFRQYGFVAGTRQLVLVPFRAFVHAESMDVLLRAPGAVPAFPETCRRISAEFVADCESAARITPDLANEWRRNLEAGLAGIAVLCSETVAGHAWVQFGGPYEYAEGVRFLIPDDCAVSRNVLVFREYRGRGLVNALNLATMHEAGRRPLYVFILTHNRPALANWKRHSVLPRWRIARRRRLGRWSPPRVAALVAGSRPDDIASRLVCGLE